MGQGIAQVCAQAGFSTILFDINPEALDKAQANIKQQLNTAVQKGKLTEAQREIALSNLQFTADIWPSTGWFYYWSGGGKTGSKTGYF